MRAFSLLMLFMLWFSFSGTLQAQEGTVGFLPYNTVDARSLAMVRANSSDIAGLGISPLNPAAISLVDRAAVSANSYHLWDTNLYTQELSFRSTSMRGHGIFVNLQYMNTGLNGLNYLGSPSFSEPDLQHTQITLAYSYALSPVISIGVLGRGYSVWNDFYATESINSDVGVIYAPTNFISYSLILRGIGYGPEYEIEGLGITKIRNRNLRESLEYSATMYYPNQTEGRLLTLSASAESLLGTGNVFFRGSLELQPIPMVAARTGYYNGPNDQGFGFGLGLNFKFINVSYTVIPDSRSLSRGHQAEILIKF